MGPYWKLVVRVDSKNLLAGALAWGFPSRWSFEMRLLHVTGCRAREALHTKKPWRFASRSKTGIGIGVEQRIHQVFCQTHRYTYSYQTLHKRCWFGFPAGPYNAHQRNGLIFVPPGTTNASTFGTVKPDFQRWKSCALSCMTQGASNLYK